MSDRLSEEDKRKFTNFMAWVGIAVLLIALFCWLPRVLDLERKPQLTQEELDQIDRVFEEHYEQERKENEKAAELGRRIGDEIFKGIVLYKFLSK